MIFVVSDTVSLDRLRTDRTLRRTVHTIALARVDDDNDDDDDLTRDEDALNRDYFGYGRRCGAFSASIALLAVGGVSGLRPELLEGRAWWVATTLLAAALLGMLAGAGYAAWRTRRTFARLAARYQRAATLALHARAEARPVASESRGSATSQGFGRAESGTRAARSGQRERRELDRDGAAA